MIDLKPITQFKIESIRALYDSVGWRSYTDNMDALMKGLEKSLGNMSAWDEDKLVGLIRYVGDGETIIYIQDLLVHPEYQRRGIARALMTSVLHDYKHVRQIVLTTDNSECSNAFYTSMGFKNVSETQGNSYIIYN